MRIPGIRNKLSPQWKFSQKGNLWKFVFAGKKIIAGETRDIENKLLYLFTIDVETGNSYLKNFLFEEGNYWISIEGANEKFVFLNRYMSPELPFHKNIIAVDLKTGKKIWENTECQYYFSTNDVIYGLQSKFESYEYFRINMSDGTSSPVPEDEVSEVINLKEKSDEDLYNEFYDYPKPHSLYPAGENAASIFSKEFGNTKNAGEIEYVAKNNLLFFNYYSESEKSISGAKTSYKNIFCIYNLDSMKKEFEIVLNENTNYNVPDNFFIKDDYLYYLKEKKEISAIKINE
ncbi:MAG: DUF4905 domain-containing protein [Ignavibacteria bacterium]|nr:DUF4905 domain-containing protein [Ignavibacteria bacterium]